MDTTPEERVDHLLRSLRNEVKLVDEKTSWTERILIFKGFLFILIVCPFFVGWSTTLALLLLYTLFKSVQLVWLDSAIRNSLRLGAIRKLAEVEIPEQQSGEVIKALREILPTGGGPAIQSAHTLGAIGNSLAEEALFNGLAIHRQNEKYAICLAIARALIRCNTKRSLDKARRTLLWLLREGYTTIREEAALELSRWFPHRDDVVKALQLMAVEDPYTTVRTCCHEALNLMGL